MYNLKSTRKKKRERENEREKKKNTMYKGKKLRNMTDYLLGNNANEGTVDQLI